MAKKKKSSSAPNSPHKQSGAKVVALSSSKPLLSGVVSRAMQTDQTDQVEMGETTNNEAVKHLHERFRDLMRDLVDEIGEEHAVGFIITSTMKEIGGADKLLDALSNSAAEMLGGEPAMEIYRVKISIKHAPCKIERILDIPDCSLGYLHEVIQDSFGWTNSHLHCFDDGEEQFGPVFEDDGVPMEWEDENDVLMSDLLGEAKKAKFRYEYDFGDSWDHQVEIVKRTPVDKRPLSATCVEGTGAVPPEDCGGVFGYGELLERLQAGKLEEMDFLDSDYDPNQFDLKKVNTALKKLKWKDFH